MGDPPSSDKSPFSPSRPSSHKASSERSVPGTTPTSSSEHDSSSASTSLVGTSIVITISPVSGGPDSTETISPMSLISSIPVASGAPKVPSTTAYSTPSTVIITTTATSTPISAASSSTIKHHGFSGKEIAAILVPILLVAALVPILAFCYLNWRHRRDRRRPPELRLPPETSLLSSYQNSVSAPSPFLDSEEIGVAKSTSQRSRRPSTYQSRSSSPAPRVPSIQTFPSPLYSDGSKFQPTPQLVSTSMYSEEKNLPEPAPPYGPEASSLRPPSTYGRVRTRSRSPSLTAANMSAHDTRFTFSDPDSDSVSDVSSEHGSGAGTRKDMDEVSVISAVSALEPDDNMEMNPHHVV